jgi:hypothetical protein
MNELLGFETPSTITNNGTLSTLCGLKYVSQLNRYQQLTKIFRF